MASRPSVLNEAGRGSDQDQSKLGLRPREAAKAIGISERSLWSLTRAGRIPHFRLGRSVIYPIEQLKTWIANQASDEGEVRS